MVVSLCVCLFLDFLVITWLRVHSGKHKTHIQIFPGVLEIEHRNSSMVSASPLPYTQASVVMIFLRSTPASVPSWAEDPPCDCYRVFISSYQCQPGF